MKIRCRLLTGLLVLFQLQTHAQLQDLTSLVDSSFHHHLENNEFLTGGEICILHKDSILLQKAYGWADVENRVPFDPQKTLVQVASVTKVITATAILQLVESGKLDINLPVKHYIGENIIHNPFPQEVTVKHLLTHTAGLDDRSTLMYATTKEEIIPLNQYIEEYLPQVVWEPGRFFNYSNHAFNLLAYIVQKVSGEDFEDYVGAHILSTLEMEYSGLGYELKSMPYLMKRYNLKANDAEETWVEEVPLSYTNLPGADDFKTTCSDMIHFMSMYLNHGRYKERQVLDSNTIALAFDPAFSYDSSMHYKQGLGWRILDREGIRCIYHEGDDKGIEAALYLYPEISLGIFMVFNNQVGAELKRSLRDTLEAIFMSHRVKPRYSYHSYTPLPALEGSYYYMNDAQSNFEKIAYLFKGSDIRIEGKDDTLMINSLPYLEFKPLVFNLIGMRGKAMFMEDDSGEVRYLSFGSSAYQKLTGWQKPETHRTILLISLCLLAISFLASLVWILLKRFKGNPIKPQYHVWILLNSVWILLFFILLAMAMDTLQIGGEVPVFLIGILGLPLLASLQLPFSVMALWAVFSKDRYSLFYRMLLSVQFIGLIIILVILYIYNFIGWQLY